MQDSLPTKLKLKQKVTSEDGCPFCKDEVEDQHQALFECHYIKDLWMQHLPSLIPVMTSKSIILVIQNIQTKCTTSDLEKLVTIAWSLWHRRDQMVFKNKHMHPEEATNHAISMQMDYKDAKDKTKKPSLNKQVCTTPMPGSVKLNVDGAIFP